MLTNTPQGSAATWSSPEVILTLPAPGAALWGQLAQFWGSPAHPRPPWEELPVPSLGVQGECEQGQAVLTGNPCNPELLPLTLPWTLSLGARAFLALFSSSWGCSEPWTRGLALLGELCLTA